MSPKESNEARSSRSAAFAVAQFVALGAFVAILVPFLQHVRDRSYYREIVYALKFSPDCSLLARSSTEGLALFDTASGRLKTVVGPEAAEVVFSPDSRWLVSGNWNGLVTVWDVATGKRVADLRAHTTTITGIAFSPDGKTLATASEDGTVCLWDLESTGSPMTWHHDGQVDSVAFSPDGKTLATGGEDSTTRDNVIKLWDSVTRELRCEVRGLGRGYVRWMAFSPDSKILATTTVDDGDVGLFDAATSNRITTLRGQADRYGTGFMSEPVFSKDGKLLALIKFTTIVI